MDQEVLLGIGTIAATVAAPIIQSRIEGRSYRSGIYSRSQAVHGDVIDSTLVNVGEHNYGDLVVHGASNNQSWNTETHVTKNYHGLFLPAVPIFVRLALFCLGALLVFWLVLTAVEAGAAFFAQYAESARFLVMAGSASCSIALALVVVRELASDGRIPISVLGIFVTVALGFFCARQLRLRGSHDLFSNVVDRSELAGPAHALTTGHGTQAVVAMGMEIVMIFMFVWLLFRLIQVFRGSQPMSSLQQVRVKRINVHLPLPLTSVAIALISLALMSRSTWMHV